MGFQLIFYKNSSKTIEKIEKIKNPFFSVCQIIITVHKQNLRSIASKLKNYFQKNFSWIFIKFKPQDSFWLKTSDLYDENPRISCFFGISPTLRSHNFFSTEPILNFLDSMERYESNSFISAILDTQSKPKAPIDTHLWRGFSKIGIHIGFTPEVAKTSLQIVDLGSKL